jgi:hypothetical protein
MQLLKLLQIKLQQIKLLLIKLQQIKQQQMQPLLNNKQLQLLQKLTLHHGQQEQGDYFNNNFLIIILY